MTQYKKEQNRKTSMKTKEYGILSFMDYKLEEKNKFYYLRNPYSEDEEVHSFHVLKIWWQCIKKLNVEIVIRTICTSVLHLNEEENLFNCF